MTTIQHNVASQTYGGTMDQPRARVTLPHVPGCLPDPARMDTAPRQPIICRPRGLIRGAALQSQNARKARATVDAIREAMEEWL